MTTLILRNNCMEGEWVTLKVSKHPVIISVSCSEVGALRI